MGEKIRNSGNTRTSKPEKPRVSTSLNVPHNKPMPVCPSRNKSFGEVPYNDMVGGLQLVG